MFSFFSKKNKLLSSIDIHSHLIPSIDDGAKDIETSLRLIKELKEIGFKKLIITPHISDMFPNNTQIILEGFAFLKEEVIKQKIDIKLEVAAEYYINEHFEKLLTKDDILSFGQKRYLLFEFSYFTPPHDIENLIYDIILKNYIPVLAHPERYRYWHHNFNKYEELKELGVLFQININSIQGDIDIQNIVEKFINSGFVDFIGSDTHHMRHIKSLKKNLKHSIYKKIFKNNTILNSTLST